MNVVLVTTKINFSFMVSEFCSDDYVIKFKECINNFAEILWNINHSYG